MKIAIIGYGKMGQTIEQLALAKGHQIILKIGIDNLYDFTKEKLTSADVAIEFSSPESAFQNIHSCIEWGVPVISGTTGWLNRKPEIEALVKAQKGAFLYASNFSVGVNIFFALNRHLAQIMGQHPSYGIRMEEIHHTQKLDAPSGTAITLAEDIITQHPSKSYWVNTNNSNEDTIPIASKRIDNVPGTHSIEYHSAIDSIEIKHTAHSRQGFAAGALLAAEWIIGKQGSFGMLDVLKF